MTDKSYSDETCRISKFTQNDVQNKDAVFITEIEMSVLKKLPNKKRWNICSCTGSARVLWNFKQ